ncbi:hypothetical protein H696_06174 [Fonticula alba]|uniref:RalA-binding protein 1 n=1 Tax=Fonticula alba TaxID=691883 RepID=A0A058YZJ2_FONAL|nr:hypothetical protein H696_06174 [Fonticula alba]KCV67405.1 hypothetical protein H696_06174 [Fonticula alba]|eukprot:XP_009498192.1 hypothetical protein H696_06174 [Fonticula alba]
MTQPPTAQALLEVDAMLQQLSSQPNPISLPPPPPMPTAVGAEAGVGAEIPTADSPVVLPAKPSSAPGPAADSQHLSAIPALPSVLSAGGTDDHLEDAVAAALAIVDSTSQAAPEPEAVPAPVVTESAEPPAADVAAATSADAPTSADDLISAMNALDQESTHLPAFNSRRATRQSVVFGHGASPVANFSFSSAAAAMVASDLTPEQPQPDVTDHCVDSIEKQFMYGALLSQQCELTEPAATGPDSAEDVSYVLGSPAPASSSGNTATDTLTANPESLSEDEAYSAVAETAAGPAAAVPAAVVDSATQSDSESELEATEITELAEPTEDAEPTEAADSTEDDQPADSATKPGSVPPPIDTTAPEADAQAMAQLLSPENGIVADPRGIVPATVMEKLVVRVPSAMILSDSKVSQSIVYVGAFFHNNIEQWRINKSYSQFVELDAKLRKEYPLMVDKVGSIPEKVMLNRLSPVVVDERKAQFESYLANMMKYLTTWPTLLAFITTNIQDNASGWSLSSGRTRAGEHASYMLKRGRRLGVWKSRFFVFRGDQLLYFTNDTEADAESQGQQKVSPLGAIPLPGAHVSIVADDPSQGIRYGFTITRDDGHYHLLCTENAADRDRWVTLLQAHIEMMAPIELTQASILAPGARAADLLTGLLFYRSNRLSKWRARFAQLDSHSLQIFNRSFKDNNYEQPMLVVPVLSCLVRSSPTGVSAPSDAPFPMVIHYNSAASGIGAPGGNPLTGDPADPESYAHQVVLCAATEAERTAWCQHIDTRSSTLASSEASRRAVGGTAADPSSGAAPLAASSPLGRLSGMMRGSGRTGSTAEFTTTSDGSASPGSSGSSSSPGAGASAASDDMATATTTTTTTTTATAGPSHVVISGTSASMIDLSTPTSPSPSDAATAAAAATSPVPGRPNLFGLSIDQAPDAGDVGGPANVPTIVWRCVTFIEAEALREEGIYRLSGATGMQNAMQQRFEQDPAGATLNPEVDSPHAVANILKRYFRELPESILTGALMANFDTASTIEDVSERMDYLCLLVGHLPPRQYTTLRYLCDHFNRVREHENENLMPLRNLNIVFSGTLRIPPLVFTSFLTYWDIIFASERPLHYRDPTTEEGADGELAEPAAVSIPTVEEHLTSFRASMLLSQSDSAQLAAALLSAAAAAEEEATAADPVSTADTSQV